MNILLVGEGKSDPRLVCGLTDRVLFEAVARLRDQNLKQCWRYCDLDGNAGYVTWISIPKRHERRIRRSRRGFGKPAPLPDQRTTRKLFQLVQAAIKDGHDIDAVVIFRDTDTHPRRREGIHAARDELRAMGGDGAWSQHIAIGVAKHKNEAWILAGFEPRDDQERARLAAITQRLGFAPNEKPHLLTAAAHGAKKRAQNILDELCPDHDRCRTCFEDTPLAVLRARGEPCGLTEFFDEVERYIAPLFGAKPPQ